MNSARIHTCSGNMSTMVVGSQPGESCQFFVMTRDYELLLLELFNVWLNRNRSHCIVDKLTLSYLSC